MAINSLQRRRRYARIGGRVIIASLAVGLFVAVASVFEPENSIATPERLRQDVDPVALSAGTYLGELVGRNHSVVIHATPDGPRYTALDGLGNVIAADLMADEVYQLLPDVNIDTLSADDNSMLDTPLLFDSALMLADYE
jgi:hypothetical protein